MLKRLLEQQRFVPIYSSQLVSDRVRYWLPGGLGSLSMVGAFFSHCWIYYWMGVA